MPFNSTGKQIFGIAFVYLVMQTAVSCSSLKRMTGKLKHNEQYTGWYAVTSEGRFFIIDRKGLFKKNWAFNLPEFPLLCYPVSRIDSILYEKCNYERDFVPNSFLVNNLDFFERDNLTSLYKAKANFKKYQAYDSIDRNGKIQKKLSKIRIAIGDRIIRAVWLEGYSYFDNVILYSNCNKDTIQSLKCDTR